MNIWKLLAPKWLRSSQGRVVRTPLVNPEPPRVENLEDRVIPASQLWQGIGLADMQGFASPGPVFEQPNTSSTTLTILSPDVARQVPLEEFAGSRVLTLNAGHDIVDQISSFLNSQSITRFNSVRIIGHGSDGALLLGDQLFNQQTLSQRANQISGWKRAFAPGADVLLYGCSVASTADGRTFVDNLARLTGTDVAASTNLTGSTTKGGDLTLEYATGQIQATTGRFAQAWDASGLTLGAPVFTSANSADFTRTVAGSFPVTATGSPTYSIAQNTFFASDFTTVPTDWTLIGSAQVTGGALALNPATGNTAGALVLPKLGASSPGSFTASFDYTVANNSTFGSPASGASFTYGLITATTGSATTMAGSNGLGVGFLEQPPPPYPQPLRCAGAALSLAKPPHPGRRAQTGADQT